jgi:hypothetical protein
VAIALEFIDVVVPVELIRRKYPGGWDQCMRDHAAAIGRRVWHDDHLFRDGAMNPADVQLLLDRWSSAGFELTEARGDTRAWKDVCVVEVMFGGPTLPCDWLVVDTSQHIAYMKGVEPGDVIGRNEETQRRDA